MSDIIMLGSSGPFIVPPNPAKSIGVAPGLDARSDVEYVLTYDVPEMGNEPAVAKGSVVINVVKRFDDGGYDYTVKTTGKRHITYYPWALAENTKENIEALHRYWTFNDAMIELRKHAERLIDERRLAVKTLAIRR